MIAYNVNNNTKPRQPSEISYQPPYIEHTQQIIGNLYEELLLREADRYSYIQTGIYPKPFRSNSLHKFRLQADICMMFLNTEQA